MVSTWSVHRAPTSAPTPRTACGLRIIVRSITHDSGSRDYYSLYLCAVHYGHFQLDSCVQWQRGSELNSQGTLRDDRTGPAPASSNTAAAAGRWRRDRLFGDGGDRLAVRHKSNYLGAGFTTAS